MKTTLVDIANEMMRNLGFAELPRPSTVKGDTESARKEARKAARAEALRLRMEYGRVLRELPDPAEFKNLAEMTREEIEREHRLLEEMERLKAAIREADAKEWALMTPEEKGEYE